MNTEVQDAQEWVDDACATITNLENRIKKLSGRTFLTQAQAFNLADLRDSLSFEQEALRHAENELRDAKIRAAREVK